MLPSKSEEGICRDDQPHLVGRSSGRWLSPLARVVGLVIAIWAIGCAGPGADGSPGGGGGGKADDLRDDLPSAVPTRIIFLIGDGMGVAHLSGGAYSSAAPLAIFGMPEMGFQTTHEHEFLTTDSAASATAMASGEKSHFGAIGVLPGTTKADESDPDTHLRTLVEVAEDAGWKTGLVATTTVVDATPAAFAAHRAQRKSKPEIALDLRHSGVDVLLGGGRKYFDQRADGQNLLGQLSSAGYSVAKTATGLRGVADDKARVIGLLTDEDMPPAASGDRPMSLAELTRHAIAVLDRDNDDGFFLMVEGSQIDRASHDLDGPASLAEVRDFDAAVAEALAYARGRDDTLVVVTADHETGALAILDPEDADVEIDALGGTTAAIARAAFPHRPSPPPFAEVALGEGALAPPEAASRALVTAYGYLSLASRPFFTGFVDFYQGTHSSTMVAVFAEGPAADYAASARDNAELGSRLKGLVAADGEAGDDDPPAAPAGPPESIILIVTDELGLAGWTAAHYAAGPLVTPAMPVTGLLATAGSDRLVPDRGAAATAIAVGAATRSGALGMAPGAGGDLEAVVSLLERADESGRATGLVTTASLTDPALAAFYAHAADGGTAGARAAQLVAEGGLDVVFGGGGGDFSADDLAAWDDRGVTVQEGWPATTPFSTGDGLVRLVAPGELDPARTRLADGADQPTLEDMTRAAITRLRKDPDGMVLVIYAGGTAGAASRLERGPGLIDEVTDVDRAVAAAIEHAATDRDTAVIVTSLRNSPLSVLDNHYGFHHDQCGVEASCGGPEDFIDIAIDVSRVPRGDGLDDADLQKEFAPVALHLQYAWLVQSTTLPAPASAELTPLFATGPGTSALEGVRTAAALGEIIADWLGNGSPP